MTLYIALWQVNTYGFNDASASLAALETALAKAEAECTEMDATCLFAAPEFLFTKSRDEHFMDEDAKEELLQRLLALSGQYNRWLMVPGTIGWFKTTERMPNREARRVSKHGSTAARNPFAYLHRAGNVPIATLPPEPTNGDPDPLGTSRLELGEYLGDRDRELAYINSNTPNKADLRFARNTAYVFHQGAHIHKYGKQIASYANRLADVGSHDQREKTVFLPGRDWPIFEHGGYKYGLEICSEHGVTHLANLTRPDPDAFNIHILLSAYTSYFPEAITGTWKVLVHADSESSKIIYGEKTLDPGKEIKLEQGSVKIYEFG